MILRLTYVGVVVEIEYPFLRIVHHWVLHVETVDWSHNVCFILVLHQVEIALPGEPEADVYEWQFNWKVVKVVCFWNESIEVHSELESVNSCVRASQRHETWVIWLNAECHCLTFSHCCVIWEIVYVATWASWNCDLVKYVSTDIERISWRSHLWSESWELESRRRISYIISIVPNWLLCVPSPPICVYRRDWSTRVLIVNIITLWRKVKCDFSNFGNDILKRPHKDLKCLDTMRCSALV